MERVTHLPQYKVTHIIHNGHMAWVILVLCYNPKQWHPWSYKYFVVSDYPTSDRNKADLFDKEEYAVNAMEKIVDSIETMHYDSIS